MSKRIALSYLLAQMLLVLIPVAPLFGQQATTGLLKAYEVGSGDVIRITVFGHTDLSGTFTVDGSGIIAFPLVGNVRVSGLKADRPLSATSRGVGGSDKYEKSPHEPRPAMPGQEPAGNALPGPCDGRQAPL